jgi:hypothetical protein
MGERFTAATSARNLLEDESRHPIMLSRSALAPSPTQIANEGNAPAGGPFPHMNSSRESVRVGSNQNLPDCSPPARHGEGSAGEAPAGSRKSQGLHRKSSSVVEWRSHHTDPRVEMSLRRQSGGHRDLGRAREPAKPPLAVHASLGEAAGR